MLVLLNSKAAGGNALKKWDKVKNSIPIKKDLWSAHVLNGSMKNEELIISALQEGERKFVAAGGDGTINFLLNSLLRNAKSNILSELMIGAIGIGSSNDFHKPFQCHQKDYIPIKMNFSDPQCRDIGYLKFVNNNKIIKKYFLINASIGLAAEANDFFNNPDSILNWLKKNNTSAAIYYAALKTIYSYSNLEIKIDCTTQGQFKTNLTNIGIVKSPFFSGDLSYDSPINYENGLFDIHLCEDYSNLQSLFLLWSLTNRKIARVRKLKSWTTNEISVTAEKPFTIEYDGEIIKTRSVTFGILQKKIKVCKS